MSTDREHHFSYGNIMVVEDNTSDLKFLSDILTKAGYQVRPASDGELALRSVRAKLPDLILLDIRLPGMSGVEVCRHLKADPETRDLPVIFISALGETELKVKALETGGVDYVNKPVEPSEVLARIRTHLNIQRLQRRLELHSEELIAEINARKKADEALQESEIMNRSLLEGSPVCNKIITTDFKLQYMSSAGVKTLKISDINTCYGKEYPPKFFCEESRIAIIEKLKVALTGEISEVECITHTTEGDELWYSHTFVPIIDDNGKVKHIVGSSVDVTERKKFENELKMSEEKYRSLIENAKDGIISTNAEGEIVSFNKTAEKIFGYTCEEMLGKSVTLLSPPSERERQKKLLENLKANKELYIIDKTIEGKGIRKNGQEFPYEGSSFTVEINEAIFLTVIIRDITERKGIEHKLLQSEKLKSLGELAGGVAHDFNNVLAAILGRAQLLKTVIEPPAGMEEKRKSVLELKEGLDVIEQASRDGAETVRRIQEFARRRDDDKHFNTVDVSEIIDSALEFTRMKWKDNAESKGIKFNIQKEFSTLPAMSGSASELREVFTNLIHNALDAMPQGGEITFKAYKEDSHIVVTVEDTGVGIPRALRARIFDPFFTTKGVQSTGLGMSVSYGIVNRHRGTISVDSIEGEGTTFTIKLPISENVTEEEKVKHFEGKPKKARIMVIEDEEQVRNLLSAILKKGGHEAEVVSDGNEGIKMFEKKEFDLVFTDLGMPGMSGWQVAEKIKGINGRVPVILITGWDIKQEASENENNWVDLIIHKPFEMDQVLNVVQEGMILRDRFKEA